MKFKRIFAIVMDSVGCGYDESSKEYNDYGANTIKHIAEACDGITLPTLEKFGYGNLTEIKGVRPSAAPIAYFGKMKEMSKGKDTMTGHCEFVGVLTTKPLMTFTDTGFPEDLIKLLEEKTGHKVIGNYAASGTEILVELGEEQMRDGSMIVYTSADSVLQIAAHEETFGLDELYRCCEIAREICMDPRYMVGRIIARPFIGTDKTNFKRTANRHDYALSPAHDTTLDNMKKAGLDVISIGKIKDIFNGCGITETYKTVSNHHGMEIMQELTEKKFTGLCFSNLVDFDALYGHRRDPKGYKEALEEFDNDLAKLITLLNNDDLLLITADHGNDPTWQGTDHTREMVPIFAYSKKIKGGDLGIRESFADFGQTIAANFKLKAQKIGVSFLENLK